MSEEKSSVIVFILVLIVIVIVILFASGFFRHVYSWIKGDSLSQELKEKAEDNFDLLVKNMKECIATEDEECFCNVFPNFPASFPKQVYVNFSTEKNNLKASLWYGKKMIREEEIGTFYPQIFFLEKDLSFQESAAKGIILEFTKRFPFEKKLKSFVVSEKIYKETGKIGSILMTKKEKDCEEIQKKLEEFPLCIPKRKEAIREFNMVTSLLKKESTSHSVNLPEGYKIRCKKNSMDLIYEDQKVEEINLPYDPKKGKKRLERKIINYTKENLLCSEEEKEIVPGQEIIISGGCIL